MGEKRLTTNKGHPIPVDQASITTGEGIDVTWVKELVFLSQKKG